MTLSYLCVLILLECYPGQSPTLRPKWHMLCVRIRSNLSTVYAKLSTLCENVTAIINMHTWFFLLEVNIYYVILYLQRLKKKKKYK